MNPDLNQSLNDLSTRYQALFDQSRDAIFILDLEGRHVQVNAAAAALLGYTRDKLIGLSYQQVVVPGEHPDAQVVLAQLLAGETIPTYERHFRRKDGSHILVEINVNLVRDADGTPLFIQSMVRDITERRQVERQYTVIAEYSLDAISLHAPDGRFVYVNQIGRAHV